MLGKLSLRNAKRSAKDYRIYILTVTIAFALMYSFNMLLFSEDIRMLHEMMISFVYVIVCVSAIVVLVIGWLVCYMSNFMLHRRSKEFGTYMVLGISNRSIGKLFLAENIMMGSVALILGVIFGSFLYQVFVLIIMHIFEATYEIQIVFSWKALLLTVLYTVLIYLYSMVRMGHKIRKMNVYDLLYSEKQNEVIVRKRRGTEYLLMGIALVAGVAGAVICHNTFSTEDELILGKMGVFFGYFVVCIYCFYLALARMLVRIFLEKRERKYRGQRLFLIRNLASKINTMSVTLATLALLLTLTLTLSQIATLFKGFFDEQLEKQCPVDILITDLGDDENYESYFQKYTGYIEEHVGVKQELILPVYDSGGSPIGKYLDGTPVEMSFWGNDTVMKYSDYQAFREMLGYDKVELKEGNYLVQGISGVKKVMDKEKPKLSIGNTELTYQETRLEGFALVGDLGAYLLIVVPDEYAEQMPISQRTYVAFTEEETSPDTYRELCLLANLAPEYDEESNGGDYIPVGNILVKGAVQAENRTMFTIMSFAMFYLALIFCCTALTILAVQQLSETDKQRRRYRVLSNLGMEESVQEKLIWRQVVVYFLLPLILSVPISIWCTVSIHQLFAAYTTNSILLGTIGGAFGLFFLIYSLYFVATYVGYRNGVKE